MKAILIFPAVLLLTLTPTTHGQDVPDDTIPASKSELSSVQTIYAAAQKEETDALEAFREIRAMQSSRALQIPLEEARKRLQIPAPERTPIDLSVLNLSSPDPARVDEILTYVRQLKEQLKAEEEAAETITMDALREEIAMRENSDKLAAEDEGEPSKDMTESALAGDPTPAESAVVDASVAHQAATEAEAMAKKATEEEQKAAPEATKVAADARKAAEAALKAATDAKNAANAHDKPAESEAATTASSEAAKAVNAAIKVAQLTGNMSFVAAGKEHSAKAAATKSGSEGSKGEKDGAGAVTSASLGGFHPGATKFLPGKARPSRRIAGFGSGIEWIYIDSWYMLGPFPNPNRRNVDTSYPPESVIDLDASYTGDKGSNLQWQFVQSPSPCIIPDNPGEYVIYYAYSELWCDQDMDLWVMVGSDDSSRIWVNDQQIWKSGYGLKPWRLNEGLRKVSFRRGINRILYRVENGWGLFGFSFAINLSPVQTAQAPATSGSTAR